MTMTTVSTADLKAHLAKYLRLVRGGETVEVLSHRHAVARLVPSPSDAEVVVVQPTRPVTDLQGLKPLRLGWPVDGVGALREDRRDR